MYTLICEKLRYVSLNEQFRLRKLFCAGACICPNFHFELFFLTNLPPFLSLTFFYHCLSLIGISVKLLGKMQNVWFSKTGMYYPRSLLQLLKTVCLEILPIQFSVKLKR